jgi:hypothetical protein
MGGGRGNDDRVGEERERTVLAFLNNLRGLGTEKE